jgi:hypothetical protein
MTGQPANNSNVSKSKIASVKSLKKMIQSFMLKLEAEHKKFEPDTLKQVPIFSKAFSQMSCCYFCPYLSIA